MWSTNTKRGKEIENDKLKENLWINSVSEKKRFKIKDERGYKEKKENKKISFVF